MKNLEVVKNIGTTQTTIRKEQILLKTLIACMYVCTYLCMYIQYVYMYVCTACMYQSVPDPLFADCSDKVLDMRLCEVLIIVLNQL